jgi:hypothetical protein
VSFLPSDRFGSGPPDISTNPTERQTEGQSKQNRETRFRRRVSSMEERQTVDLEVTGSTPVHVAGQ